MSLEVQLTLIGFGYALVSVVLTVVATAQFRWTPMGPGWTVLLWLAWLSAGTLITTGLTLGEMKRGVYPEDDHGR